MPSEPDYEQQWNDRQHARRRSPETRERQHENWLNREPNHHHNSLWAAGAE